MKPLLFPIKEIKDCLVISFWGRGLGIIPPIQINQKLKSVFKRVDLIWPTSSLIF